MYVSLLKYQIHFKPLAKAVCFLFWYTLGVFYTNLLKRVGFFFSPEVPTLVLLEELLFVCLLDLVNIQCV